MDDEATEQPGLNPTVAPAVRDALGRFVPGQTGNPGGRQPATRSVRLLARTYTEEAINTLGLHLANPDGRIAVAAAVALLDRAWGKPIQAVRVAEQDQADMDSKSDSELVELVMTMVETIKSTGKQS